MLHTTDVMAIFVIFWLILAKIWFPWQRPLDPSVSDIAIFVLKRDVKLQLTLDPCNQKCLLWIDQPRNPPVISNHNLVISVEMHLYAFIAIFVPILVAMVTPLCPLCTGVS